MTGLRFLAGIIMVLFLLALLRVGGSVEYSREGLEIKVRLWMIWVQIYPLKKKNKRAGEKSKQEKIERADEKKKGGALKQVKEYLPLAGEAAGELKRKIRIDSLRLDLVAGAADVAGAAMLFGGSNMALGMLWPIFEQNFLVREHRFRTAVDFEAESPTIYVYLAFSARVGQLIGFCVRFGWKFLKLLLKDRKRIKTQKEAI